MCIVPLLLFICLIYKITSGFYIKAHKGLAILFEHGKSYTGLVAEQYSCKYLLLQLLFYERSFLQLYEISAAVRVYFNAPVSIMAFGQIASDAMSKLLLAGPETEPM